MTSKVTIICRNPGMYRNGVPHPARAVYEPGHWTSEQLQNFRDDPAFEVVEGEDLTENVNTLASENSALKSQVADLTSKVAAVTAERDQAQANAANWRELADKLKAEAADASSAALAAKTELEKIQADAAKSGEEKAAAKK